MRQRFLALVLGLSLTLGVVWGGHGTLSHGSIAAETRQPVNFGATAVQPSGFPPQAPQPSGFGERAAQPTGFPPQAVQPTGFQL
ncbi:MAG: hypothetical protein U0232_07245 [Thermomicrobiales bacterium]